MPPCAQRLEAPSPRWAPETTVTGSGESLSAVNRPARPVPTMTTPPWAGSCVCVVLLVIGGPPVKGAGSVVEIDHTLDRSPRPQGYRRGHRHLLFEEDEGLKDLRQRDPLHMRAEIAGPHEGD